jgi:hypothetical protein
MPDFLHPSAKGYEIWGRALQPILAKVFAEPRTPRAANTEQEPPPHPSVGQRFVPTDVDWAHPLYATGFDDEKALADWKLEGGKRMAVEHAKLVLENDPGTGAVSPTSNHLVCWLTKVSRRLALSPKRCP